MRLQQLGIGYYLSGIMIMTLGIVLAIFSMLGTSPFDALLVGLYRTFGLTIGSWEIVVGLAMILGNAIAERKRPEYFALITSIITGIGIDSWYFLLHDILITDLLMINIIYLIVSLFISGIGVAIYLQSNISPNPIDRTMLIISKRTGWNLTYSRAAINIILVIVAFIFGGAIGIGTLANALLTGYFIHLFTPIMRKIRQSGLQKEKMNSSM